MRLVKPGGDRRQAINHDAFEQVREVGGRLEYLVGRYGRLAMDVAEGRPLPDLRDSVELMNSQLGYVARRLQELLLAQFELARNGDSVKGAAVCSGGIVAASR